MPGIEHTIFDGIEGGNQAAAAHIHPDLALMHSPGANVGRWATALMDLVTGGMDHEGKQPQFGLRLPYPYPENLVKSSVWG